MKNNFPNEYLFTMSTKSPWFKDIANYLATGNLLPQLSTKEK